MLVRESIPLRTVDASSPTPATADAEARHLAAAIGRGDEAAFHRLYQQYHRRLLRFAFAVGRGDEAAAQDAVQSAFITAAKKLRQVESERHLWNWLAQVVRQQLAKSLRKDQRHPAVSLSELPDCADDLGPDVVLEESLDAALLVLEPEDRQVVEWFYFEHLSHKEIAEKTAATPKAVSSRLERARAKLRVLINRKLSHET